MLGRLVRRIGVLTMLGVAAYVGRRTVQDRRHERRLAAPVSSWPDVLVELPTARATVAGGDGAGRSDATAAEGTAAAAAEAAALSPE